MNTIVSVNVLPRKGEGKKHKTKKHAMNTIVSVFCRKKKRFFYYFIFVVMNTIVSGK